ncbi:MAG: hypothetical protein MJE68_33460 [Proteobacteria bacterium]|nr:hypothetical protein [Pseudomonadota bacterium]
MPRKPAHAQFEELELDEFELTIRIMHVLTVYSWTVDCMIYMKFSGI